LESLYISGIEKSTTKCGGFLPNRVQRKCLTKDRKGVSWYISFKGGEIMITKIRTNIFLTRTELRKLRALSKKTGAPVAELVRRAVDEYLERFERKGKGR
jgi:hypothetical protein